MEILNNCSYNLGWGSPNLCNTTDDYTMRFYMKGNELGIIKEYKDKIVINTHLLLSFLRREEKPIYSTMNIFDEKSYLSLTQDLKNTEYELAKTVEKDNETVEYYYWKHMSELIVYGEDYIIITNDQLKNLIKNEDNKPVFFRHRSGQYEKFRG